MNTHKSVILGLALAVALTLPAAAQYGSPQGGPPPGGGMGGPHHGQGMGMNVDQRVQMLTRQLDLTPEQQTKAKGILEQQQKELMALRQNTSLSQEERQSKMQEIHRNGMEQIRGMLTPEQQQKMQQMHQNMEHHQGGHENGPPSNPPQEK